MAEQNRPASNEQAPDTATTYERAKPEKEAGMGRMDNNRATPTQSPDSINHGVTNKQNPEHQLNAQDVVDSGANRKLHGGPVSPQPDHSMKDEEPMGWDQAPEDINNPQMKRHPKTDGKGGTA